MNAFLKDRLNTQQTAEYMGVSVKTLAMKRSEGTGPRFTKYMGKVFYCKAELDAWIDGHGQHVSTAQARYHQFQVEKD